jgi:hypothetical protein
MRSKFDRIARAGTLLLFVSVSRYLAWAKHRLHYPFIFPDEYVGTGAGQ